MRRLLIAMIVKWVFIYALGKYLQRLMKEDTTAARS